MTATPLDPVEHETVVPVTPEVAFDLYVNRPGRTHPRGGQSGEPARIVYEPFAGGRWYEIGADGTEYEWGQVLTWDPPRTLTLAWMVGAATGVWAYDPDPAHASLAEITFSPEGEGTRVRVRHHGFERHGPTGGDIRRGVAGGWLEDLEDLRAAAVRTGSPATADAPSGVPGLVGSPHVILLTRDLPRTTRFYAGLGFVEVFRVPADGDPVHVDLELDGYRIGFATDEAARSDHSLEPVTTGHRAVVVLWTDDLEAAVDRAVGLGGTVLQPPRPFLEHLRVAFVEDPSGHPVQLVQEVPGR